MFNREVIGIALTDVNGCITNESGNPIFVDMPDSLRNLDQSILRNATSLTPLEKFGTPQNRVIVVGTNTYNDIKDMRLWNGLLDGKPKVVVSDADSVGLLGRSNIEHPANECPKNHLRRRVMQYAIEHDLSVLVLGGVSVYESFAGLYTEFHHCRFAKDIKGTKRLSRPVVPYKTASRYIGGLISPAGQQTVYWDNEYSYDVYFGHGSKKLREVS